MTNFGFEYFTNRASFFTEMAGRPSSRLTSPAGKKMSEYIKIIGSVMKHGGTITDDNENTVQVPGIPAGRGSAIQNRTYKYILSTITGILDYDVDPMADEPESENDPDFSGGTSEDIAARDLHAPTSKYNKLDLLTRKAIDILGGPAEAAKYAGKSIKLYTSAIAKWVDDNPDYVTSKEFADKLTDKNNILSYIAPPTVRSATLTNRGFAKARKAEQLYGIDVEDYHRLVSQIATPLTQLRKLQWYSSKRKNPSQSITSETVENNIATDNIFVVVYVLDDLKSAKDTIRKVIESQMDTDKFYEILEYGGSAIEDEDEKQSFATISHHVSDLNANFFSKKYNMSDSSLVGLMTLASNPRYSDFFEETIELFAEFEHGLTVREIKHELDSLKSFMDKSTHSFLDLIGHEVSELSEESSSNKYPEFSQSLVDKIFNTPELQAQFDQWYNTVYLAEKARDIAEANEKRNEPGMTAISGEHGLLDRAINAKSDKLSKLESEYEHTPYEGDIKSQYKESYIMNYMSDQISKDRFTPRGEFKDRGFKKPSNYWQGANR